MSLTSFMASVLNCLKTSKLYFRGDVARKALQSLDFCLEARAFSGSYKNHEKGVRTGVAFKEVPNSLFDYFMSHKEGHGIWKWKHYFDVYHRHLSKFIGTDAHMMEVGVYSGGSLLMWEKYFGEKVEIYGVDIEKTCEVYQKEKVNILIGDQESREFWKGVKTKINSLDIIIDDGGHTPGQQKVTLEEMLPSLKPGGVYICEDIHGRFNDFTAYATNLVHELNGIKSVVSENGVKSNTSDFQKSIHSIHFYPYMLVIEKRSIDLPEFEAPKHGSIWQPFLG